MWPYHRKKKGNFFLKWRLWIVLQWLSLKFRILIKPMLKRYLRMKILIKLVKDLIWHILQTVVFQGIADQRIILLSCFKPPNIDIHNVKQQYDRYLFRWTFAVASLSLGANFVKLLAFSYFSRLSLSFQRKPFEK